ncbi:F-box/kelch-repeat protein At3g04660-like [Rosa rugosa]|uniref:F-box/kelch-repeat protein At3g04660-like n=1 Tax=Rosa rugosa TaxID=74645 RepID=UPI002B415783|nr:F-box/kelch-repeat protein At3g04660-like [Rosa rugosa]
MAVSNNMDRPDHPVRILNPTTLECITIPYSSPSYPTSYVTYHFGFNPLADEYKILQVQRLEKDYRGMSSWVYQIFTLGKSSWRQIEEDFDLNHLVPFDSHECHFRKGGLYANGVMYWLTRDMIVVFEFVREKFRVMPLPQGSRLYSRPKLFEMGGCLAIIRLQEKGLELSILKDYQDQVWVNESTTFTVRPPKGVEYHIPLGTIHTGEEILLRPQMTRVVRKEMVHFYNRKR